MDVDVPMSAYRSNGKTLVPLTALHRVTQPPLLMQPEKVECFADLMRKGCEFAPVLVREEEGGIYVVFDGHHRTAASRHCSFTHIPVIIQTR